MPKSRKLRRGKSRKLRRGKSRKLRRGKSRKLRGGVPGSQSKAVSYTPQRSITAIGKTPRQQRPGPPSLHKGKKTRRRIQISPEVTQFVKDVLANAKVPVGEETNPPYETMRARFAEIINAGKFEELGFEMMNLKPRLSPGVNNKIHQYLMTFQENPMDLPPVTPCPYGHACRRQNPVHRLGHTFSNYATILAYYMNPPK
jgi:hypothetical protein